jgi:mono/diheme cytochrome c family protein
MKRVLFILLIVSTMGLAACGTSTAPTNPDVTATLEPVPAEYAGKTNPLGADAATAGATVFNTNCSACHGSQAHGDGPAGASLDPAPKNLVELSKVASDDYLFWRISTGRSGSAMVAWKGILTDEQIWQVIAYIHTLK